MKNDEQLRDYIALHTEEEPSFLKDIVRQSHLQLIHPRMLSGHVQGRILKMLVRMINPDRILELGSFAGYSAICMAEGMHDSAMIDTIEFNDELEYFLKSNIAQSGFSRSINVYFGDCVEIIATSLSANCYDLVFIDANKRDYIAYYEAVMPLVPSGGFIVADNVLWDGHVIEEHVKSNDFQTKAIKAFNDYVMCDERVFNALFPIRDGLMVLQKK